MVLILPRYRRADASCDGGVHPCDGRYSFSVVSSTCNLYRLMVQGVVELPVQSEGGETKLTVITMCD